MKGGSVMYAVGIDVGGTKAAFGIANPEDGKLLQPVETCPVPCTYPLLWDAVSGIVQRLEGSYGKVSLIGLGAPGTLDKARTQVIKAPNATVLEGQPLRSDLETMFSCPVYMGGDVQASAAAEALYGADAEDLDTELVFHSIGTGYGVGLVLRDNTGVRSSRATQYGHVTVVSGGAPCGCGAIGCAEAYVTSWGMMRCFKLKTFDEIDALSPGQQALVGQWIGKVVQASIVGAPDIRRIVFGGTVVVSHPWMIDAARHWLEDNTRIVSIPEMTLSSFGVSAGAVGCIAMAEMARRQGTLN
jgi:predicted NBD/HSP70 family sugar kinase